MFAFFRRIRKSLLNDGKTSKYITYALGEILLVMIGILLALQVNNWNERRKSDMVMHGRVKALLKDLHHNIEQANGIIAFADNYDSIFDRVIANRYGHSVVDDFSVLLGSQTAQFFKESLQAVLGEEEQLPKAYSHLIPELKELNRLFRSQEKWEDISLHDREDIMRNVLYVEDYDFTSLDEKEFKEEFKKLVSSNRFRNRVLLSYASTFLEENAWDITQIRAASLILLGKLNAIIKDEEISVESLFEQKGLVRFASFDCQHPLNESKYLENFRSYRLSFPFYNAVNSVRHLDFLDAELNVYRTITLQPNEFHFNNYELYDDDRFELRSGEQCLGRFRAVRNGYLIVNE
ncbi:MAG: hypothetical protein AAGB24_08590 [Bacteroidota bacterium]